LPSTPFLDPRGRNQYVVSGAVYVTTAILCGLGLLGKLELIGVAFHLHGVPTVLVLFATVFAPMLWPFAIRFRAICTPLFLIGIAGVVLFVYPYVRQLHKVGRGSDQADCVIVAGNQMLKGHWPYDRTLLWSHNPMSCGPGWSALQAPTTGIAGYQATILLIWLCALVALVQQIGWQRASAILSIVFLSGGVWLALANGSDFLSFGICILALAIVYDSSEKASLMLNILIALVVQFRAPVVLLPMFLKEGKGRLSRILLSIIASATFGVFLLWKPRQMVVDGPLFLFRKLPPYGQAPHHPIAVWSTFVLLFVGGLLFCVWLSDRFAGLWPTLIYMLAVFGLPALVSLVEKVGKAHSLIGGLRDWEGGMWLLACLPLAAGLFVRDSGMLSALAFRSVNEDPECDRLMAPQ
jgi:hypothetical protein